MLASKLGQQKRGYFLAFNAKAKARPNFGLRGVGFYTSETYHSTGRSLLMFPILAIPWTVGYLVNKGKLFSLLDEIAGGGPQELDYGFPNDAKPWEFRFRVGEGFAAGPPRLRPAEGAAPLDHH